MGNVSAAQETMLTATTRLNCNMRLRVEMGVRADVKMNRDEKQAQKTYLLLRRKGSFREQFFHSGTDHIIRSAPGNFGHDNLHHLAHVTRGSRACLVDGGLHQRA